MGISVLINGKETKLEVPDEALEQAYFEEDDGTWLDPMQVKEGMERELNLMNQLEVYEELNREDLPRGTKVWTARWCHRKKGDGVRSRFVVRQYANGHDPEMFAGTPGKEAVRVLLAIAIHKGYDIIPADFSVAFMHTPLTGDPIYITPPDEVNPDGTKVWRLLKALNGLREAAKQFQEHLASILVQDLQFNRSQLQPTVFYHPERQLRLVVHVDDPLCSGPRGEILQLYNQLGDKLAIRVGAPFNAQTDSVYLGARYRRVGDVIIEHPAEGYMEGILDIVGMKECNRLTTPGIKESIKEDQEDPALDAARHHTYRSVVGKLQFIAPIRPDIHFALKELGRRLHQPTEASWRAMRRLVRYVAGTRNYGLFLTTGSNDLTTLHGVTDTDWAGCQTTRKSTSAGAVFWGDFLLMSYARTQSVISQSSPEAELYGCVSVAAELLYLQGLMHDMGIEVNLRIDTDASSAKAMASRRGVGKVRHIMVKYLWLQALVNEKRISIRKIPGSQNVTDCGTKYVDVNALRRCAWEYGLRDVNTGKLSEIKPDKQDNTNNQEENASSGTVDHLTTVTNTAGRLIALLAALLQPAAAVAAGTVSVTAPSPRDRRKEASKNH